MATRTNNELSEWEHRRSSLNHNWLQNHYMLMLRHLARADRGDLGEEEKSSATIEEAVANWRSRSIELRQLVDDLPTILRRRFADNQSGASESVDFVLTMSGTDEALSYLRGALHAADDLIAKIEGAQAGHARGREISGLADHLNLVSEALARLRLPLS